MFLLLLKLFQEKIFITMLSVYFNGNRLDVPNNIKINFKLKSPLFNSNNGSMAYSFEVSNSPLNNKVLGFPGRIEQMKYSFVDGEITILFNDTIFFSGIGKAEKVSNGNIYMTAGFARGVINYKAKNDYLNSIDYSKNYVTFPFTDIFRFTEEFSVNNPFVLSPVINDGFYSNVSTSPSTIFQNPFQEASGSNRLELNPYGTEVTPFFYLNYILKNMFQFYGITLIDSYLLSNHEYKNVCIYTPVSCGRFNPSNTSFFLTLRPQDFMPEMKMSDFISTIETQFNCAFFFNHSGNECRILSIREIIESLPTYEVDPFIIGKPEIKFKSKKGLRLEFEKDKTDSFYDTNCKSIFEKGYTLLDPIDDVANFTDVDVRTRTPNILRYVKSKGAYYQSYVPNTGSPVYLPWNFYAENYQIYLSDRLATDLFTLKSKMCALPDSYEFMQWSSLNGSGITAPRTSQPGYNVEDLNQIYISPTPILRPEFGLRFMYFRGLQNTSDNIYQYPMVSSHVKRYDGPNLVDIEGANHSFRFLKEKSVIDVEYGATTQFFNTDNYQLEYHRYLTIDQLKNIDLSEKYTYKGVPFITDELSGQLSLHGISPCKFIANSCRTE